MEERQTTTVVLYEGKQYDEGFPAGYGTRLVDFIAWLADKLESVPSEFRDSATCEIGNEGGYEGSHYGTLEIEYRRPETDQEVVERYSRAEARSREVEQRELATLRALQAKYSTIS